MNENVVNQQLEGGTEAQNFGGKKRKVSVEALGVAFSAITNGDAVNTTELDQDEMDILVTLTSAMHEVLFHENPYFLV